MGSVVRLLHRKLRIGHAYPTPSVCHLTWSGNFRSSRSSKLKRENGGRNICSLLECIRNFRVFSSANDKNKRKPPSPSSVSP